MANELKLANFSTQTDVISAAISRALIEVVGAVQHVYAEDLPVGTLTKKARKDAALALAAVVSEADAVASYADFTQTSVSLTIAKEVIASKLTVEAQDFGGVSDEQIIQKQAVSIARKLDNNVKALVSGLSQSVTCDSTAVLTKFMDAAYAVEAGYAGANGKNLVCWADPKALNELRKELVTTGATAFSNIALLSLLTGMAQQNCYVGSAPGIDFFKIDGLPTNSSKRYQCVFNPELCWFGMYSPAPKVLRKAPDAGGLFTELTSYVYGQVAEWNDAAGVIVKSAQ